MDKLVNTKKELSICVEIIENTNTVQAYNFVMGIFVWKKKFWGRKGSVKISVNTNEKQVVWEAKCNSALFNCLYDLSDWTKTITGCNMQNCFQCWTLKKSLRSRNCLCVCGVRRRGVAVLLMLVPGSSLLRKLSHKVPHTLSVSHPTQVHINRPTEAHPNINH